MTDWRGAFALQAEACRALAAPQTAELCEALARAVADDPGPVGDRIRNWLGDPSYHGDSVPLRLNGAMQALVLTGALPSAPTEPDHIIETFQDYESWFLEWLEHAPQTNEVGRAAVLITACWFLSSIWYRDFDLLELGASAGLNLNFPLYDINKNKNDDAAVNLTPEWRGTRPVSMPVLFGAARGVDLNPLDARQDALRLMAYVWPDQPQRLERLREALKIAARHPPQVDRGDAGSWLVDRLGQPPVRGRFVYHTVAAQYFPPATRAMIETALQKAGAATTAGKPLCHFSMEADGASGTALHLRLWDRGRMRHWHLGRAHAHAQWIDWQPKETA